MIKGSENLGRRRERVREKQLPKENWLKDVDIMQNEQIESEKECVGMKRKVKDR